MALSQKHRSTIYRQLSPIIGEEEADALLSQFPSNDLDTPATKDFVRAEINTLRAEMHDRFREMTMWIAGTNVVAVAVATALSRLLG